MFFLTHRLVSITEPSSLLVVSSDNLIIIHHCRSTKQSCGWWFINGHFPIYGCKWKNIHFCFLQWAFFVSCSICHSTMICHSNYGNHTCTLIYCIPFLTIQLLKGSCITLLSQIVNAACKNTFSVAWVSHNRFSLQHLAVETLRCGYFVPSPSHWSHHLVKFCISRHPSPHAFR
jgi:hypothetical protein